MSSTEDKPMSFLEHLEELRWVIIKSLLSLVPATVAGWYLGNQVMILLTLPLKRRGISLAYFSPAEPIFARLKIAFFTGLFLALPYIFWQIWLFIRPALKPNERRYVRLLVPVAYVLFIAGVVFAYTTVFQVGVNFFIDFAATSLGGLAPTFSISRYLSFTMGFLLPFGVVFELPLIFFFLALLGLVRYRFLVTNRKYAILLIFIVAAVLTPGPDIISQLLMAAPLYILFEVSLIIVWLVERAARRKEALAEQEESN